MTENSSATMFGTVEKIIPSLISDEPDKAQIAVEGADELYKEIRIENALRDKNGNEVCLKEGAHVELTVAAEQSETTPK